PEINVVVRLDDEQDDKKGGDKKEEKKARIVIQIDGKTITVPIDVNSEDIKKEVEKAVTKAREQAKAAGDKAKAAADKLSAERRKQLEAAEKALKALDKDLGGEHLKALMKQIEDLKAGQGEGAKEALKAMAEAHKALEQLHGQFPQFAQGAMAVRVGAGRLGVRVEKPSAAMADQLDLPKGQGMVVVDVVKESAAAKAGLKANDILLELDGKAVPSDSAEFSKQVRAIKADEDVSAVVLRKGRKETVKGIKLPEAKAEP